MVWPQMRTPSPAPRATPAPLQDAERDTAVDVGGRILVFGRKLGDIIVHATEICEDLEHEMMQDLWQSFAEVEDDMHANAWQILYDFFTAWHAERHPRARRRVFLFSEGLFFLLHEILFVFMSSYQVYRNDKMVDWVHIGKPGSVYIMQAPNLRSPMFYIRELLYYGSAIIIS